MRKILNLKIMLLFCALSLLLLSGSLYISYSSSSFEPELAQPIQETLMKASDNKPNEEIINTTAEFKVGIVEPEYVEKVELITYTPQETCFIGGTQVESMKDAILTDAQFKIVKDFTEENVQTALNECVEETALVVILFDVGYLDQVKDIKAVIDNIVEKNDKLYFICANIPIIDENTTEQYTAQDIMDFNEILKQITSCNVLDLYAMTLENGIKPKDDGIKFNQQQISQIFVWLLDNTNKREILQLVEVGK